MDRAGGRGQGQTSALCPAASDGPARRWPDNAAEFALQWYGVSSHPLRAARGSLVPRRIELVQSADVWRAVQSVDPVVAGIVWPSRPAFFLGPVAKLQKWRCGGNIVAFTS